MQQGPETSADAEGVGQPNREASLDAPTGFVISHHVEYWLQEKLNDGCWIDYTWKDNPTICHARVEELKREKPGRTFRPIARIITDMEMTPNDQAQRPAHTTEDLQHAKDQS